MGYRRSAGPRHGRVVVVGHLVDRPLPLDVLGLDEDPSGPHEARRAGRHRVAFEGTPLDQTMLTAVDGCRNAGLAGRTHDAIRRRSGTPVNPRWSIQRGYRVATISSAA